MKPGDIILVYSGKHYGRPHRLLTSEGQLWTARHEASGDIVTFLRIDADVPATRNLVRAGKPPALTEAQKNMVLTGRAAV